MTIEQCPLHGPAAVFLALFWLSVIGCRTGGPSFASEPKTRAEGNEDARTIRIGTFNIDGYRDLGALGEAVAQKPDLKAADVLMIQEVAESIEAADLQALGERLSLPFVHAAERRADAPGLALFSRYPLTDLEVIYLPRFHLGYRSRSRISIGATILSEGRQVRLYNVHLDTRLRLEDRIRQLEPAVVRARAAARAIIAGDVNTIRSVPLLLPWIPLPIPGFDQSRGLDEFMRCQGFDTPLEGVSWTGPLRMRLDAIFTRGFESAARGVVMFPGMSDHLALWSDLVPIPLELEGSGR